jgi:hypothetical protein
MGKNLIILGITILVSVLVLMFLRARQILETWAEENGYEILSSDLRLLSRGPYSWTLFGKQWVFHVTVRDSERTVRTGFVKCGSFWWGIWVNRAEAKWDMM